MYEFRGATLQEGVHQALRYSTLSTKKLAKVAAKFDFTARLRMGNVLFVGEGNLSFALTMSRNEKPGSDALVPLFADSFFGPDNEMASLPQSLNVALRVARTPPLGVSPAPSRRHRAALCRASGRFAHYGN